MQGAYSAVLIGVFTHEKTLHVQRNTKQIYAIWEFVYLLRLEKLQGSIWKLLFVLLVI